MRPEYKTAGAAGTLSIIKMLCVFFFKMAPLVSGGH